MKIWCKYGPALEYSGHIVAFINEGGETRAIVVNVKMGTITAMRLNAIKILQL